MAAQQELLHHVTAVVERERHVLKKEWEAAARAGADSQPLHDIRHSTLGKMKLAEVSLTGFLDGGVCAKERGREQERERGESESESESQSESESESESESGSETGRKSNAAEQRDRGRECVAVCCS